MNSLLQIDDPLAGHPLFDHNRRLQQLIAELLRENEELRRQLACGLAKPVRPDETARDGRMRLAQPDA